MQIQNKNLALVFKIIVIIFAVIGFVLTAGYFAIKFGLTNTSGIIDNQRKDFLNNIETPVGQDSTEVISSENYYWQTLPEWKILEAAIIKDKDIIDRAARDSGVPARLIVANLSVEQLRFFFDDRESFKKFFEPLKILGSQSKFSWGVMGIKEETALKIESNLKDKNSEFYPGKKYEHLLDFHAQGGSVNVGHERFTRMTDQHDHYWSYLYAGLFLKEIETQWQNAGYPINDKPEVLATLFNIGFSKSKPNPNPLSGGAEIPVGDKIYSFGSLAKEFYNSNVLLGEFPR